MTRLARLTGLDRCGVEVVAAVRPRGHVLQVSQGKGRTLAAAQWSALGEAIELSAAEEPALDRLRFGPAPGHTTWDVGGLRVAWVAGRALDGREAWVPAGAVFCPRAGVAWLGPEVTPWRSNGLGAHPTSRRAAERHALAEVVERDALARSLPDGWHPAAIARRLLGRLDEVALSRRGFEAWAFDLSAGTGPVAGVLLFDLEGDVVPLTAGYACRATLAEAVEAAWLEAAQTRLTEIQGAREDVTLAGQREAGRELREALLRSRPARKRVASVVRPPRDTVLVTLRREPWVVKAVSERALVSELL
ncbi:MAG: YcaO-like family protein [Myxococcaceae bacterium]